MQPVQDLNLCLTLIKSSGKRMYLYSNSEYDYAVD